MLIRNTLQQCKRFCFALTLLISSALNAAPTASRYFPFIDDVSSHFQRADRTLKPSVFFLSATSANHRGGQTCGLPELDGVYNLRHVIDSYTIYRSQAGLSAYTNPLPDINWRNKDLFFKAENKVRAGGIAFSYDHAFNWHGLSAGFFMPVMYATSVQRFLIDAKNSDSEFKTLTDTEHAQLDAIRRNLHSELGLSRSTADKIGLGDLDLHLSWNRVLDHWKVFRTFSLHARAGLLVPAGSKNDNNNSSSVPFGSKHWGNYLEAGLEAELKQTLRAGIVMSSLWMYKDSSARRIAVYKEPSSWSPLVAQVTVNPGWTFKMSPYFVLENLMQGVHAHLGYTYVRHGEDEWIDKRSDTTIKSYLNQTASASRDPLEIRNNKGAKEYATGWRSHYLSIKLSYDSVAAMQDWKFKPVLSATVDYPFAGRGIAKTTQLTLSASLHI